LPSSPASCAPASPPIPITCNSCSRDALGRKPSDEFAVPLCRAHHRAAHRAGEERAWWKAAGIDPIKIARKLWKETLADKRPVRPNPLLQAAQTNPRRNAADDEKKAP
jgi:hypothetical protein